MSWPSCGRFGTLIRNEMHAGVVVRDDDRRDVRSSRVLAGRVPEGRAVRRDARRKRAGDGRERDDDCGDGKEKTCAGGQAHDRESG